MIAYTSIIACFQTDGAPTLLNGAQTIFARSNPYGVTCYTCRKGCGYCLLLKLALPKQLQEEVEFSPSNFPTFRWCTHYPKICRRCRRQRRPSAPSRSRWLRVAAFD